MDLLGILVAALTLGIASSAHCALMCGPIQSAWLNQAHWKGTLLYHFGRWITYVLIALIFYSIQRTWLVSFASTQTALILGITLITGALMYIAVDLLFPSSWTRPLMKLASIAGQLPSSQKQFVFGMLNGALPCGMVWMAASMTATQGQLAAIPIIMLAFIVGTLPALYGIKTLHWIMHKLQKAIRWPFQIPGKLKTPTIALIIGVILVVRGLYFQEGLYSGNQHTPEAYCAPIPSAE